MKADYFIATTLYLSDGKQVHPTTIASFDLDPENFRQEFEEALVRYGDELRRIFHEQTGNTAVHVEVKWAMPVPGSY